MNEIKEATIARLAGIAHDRRQRYKMLGMMQTSSDPEKARQQVIDYELAYAALLESEKELREAQRT